MKIEIVRRIVKYFSLAALFVCAVFLSAVAADAQTKRRPPAAKFSVPCAEALNIGLSAVEKRHSKEILRKTGGGSDSGTEFAAEKNAFENYLQCRRADTARRSKKLPTDERRFIVEDGKRMRRLAEMRVNLLDGVAFNERDEDPINYAVSQNAVVLIEDSLGTLTGIYLEIRDYDASRNTEIAERNVEEIGRLLKRIERVSRYTDQAAEFAAFKAEIEKFLAEIADTVGNEKRATTVFLVRLLRMNLADEN